jgi:hypothetical protein
MSKAQRHVGVGGLLREAIRSPIGFVAARKAGATFSATKSWQKQK